MARTRTRATRQDEGTKQRHVTDQHTPFTGLALAPLGAILVSWVLHYLIVGLHWGPIHLGGSLPFLGVVIALITVGAILAAYQSWHLSADRRAPLRYALTASTYVVGQWMAILIWVGPNRWWNILFLIVAWIVVGLWVPPRLHVLRHDPREDTGDHEDDLRNELSLKGFKFGKPDVTVDPKTGEPERMVYDVKHRFGATRHNLTNALGNLESAVAGPEGLSRVVKAEDGKSNHSTLTLILKDPLVGRVPYNGPSHPGGSIVDRALIGRYDDGEPVYVWIAGGVDKDGIEFPPTGYAFMGMTRAGKTVCENRLLIESAITRTDACILYLNEAKGEQDVGPIIDGVEAAVLAGGPDNKAATIAAYRDAFRAVKNIIDYRQRVLAKHQIQAWSARACWHEPLKAKLAAEADGHKYTGMDPMPALIVHVGEADTILEVAGEDAVFIASKGLSIGILAGWSLQRWSATSMPTDLRFNIGARFCFGVGDSYSAHFALSEPTIDAGAHPENWRNTKPGRFFMEAAGVDDTRWPVSAKAIGDINNDALYGNMRRDCAEHAPNMARLDQGSANSTRGWWAEQSRRTNTLRDRIHGRNQPEPVPDDPTPTAQETPPVTPHPAAAFRADPPTDAQDPDRMEADEIVRSEIDTTTEVNGEQIYGGLITDDPDDPDYFDDLRATNPGAAIPVPPKDDIDMTDPRPDAPSPEDARREFNIALRAVYADPALRDPDRPDTAVFRTGMLRERYKFRSRPWYSRMLRETVEGEQDHPDGLYLERMPDRKGEGWYRIVPGPPVTGSDSHME